MKKFLSLCLVIAFVMISVPQDMVELSANAATEGNYSYSVENGEATITDVYAYIRGEVIIPSVLGGYPVISIGESAFSQLSDMTSVTIPNTIKVIGKSAFYNCKKLTSITIPDGVTSIGAYAFIGCENIASISLPDSLEMIGEDAFSSTAYYRNSLNWEKYYVDSVTVADSALYINNHLIKVNTSLSSNLYNIKSGTVTIADNAFYKCRSIKTINIPKSVSNIGDRAFYECNSLTKINIPSGVTEIGEETFYNSGLEYIILPDGVTTIGEHAFYSCFDLTSITLPDSLISIGVDAFYDSEYYTNLDNWTGKILYIDNHLIKAKEEIAGSYTIKSGTLSIADYAFSDSMKLVVITIPDSVVSIGCWSFNECPSLTSVKIGKGVTRIGRDAFYKSFSISEVRITDIKAWCNIIFENYNSNPLAYLDSSDLNLYLNGEILTDLVIPDSITKINDYAFFNCTSLISVTIPNNVTHIGYAAFDYCDALTDLYYLGSKDRWENVNIEQFNTSLLEANIHYLLPGDVDSDEKINLNDLVTIAQYVAGWKSIECNEAVLDVNGDEVIDLRDITHFARYLAGWDGIVLY